MDGKENAALMEVLEYLPTRIKKIILTNRSILSKDILEIRIRLGLPVVFKTANSYFYITLDGKKTQLTEVALCIATQEEIDSIVQKACGYSIHSHQEDLKNGFLTIEGGHRIGLCGTAVLNSNGQIDGIRNIQGLNIRISKEVQGAANEILNQCFQEDKQLKNVLILGPPMSGKTIILRDLCRQISNGVLGDSYSCAVIDERLELSKYSTNLCVHPLGNHTDILYQYSKPQGISQAIRTLSPAIIFCDEIGSIEDSNAIMQGVLAGVYFIATAHAENFENAVKRSGIKTLLKNNIFDYLIFLDTGERVGKIKEIIDMRKNNENIWNTTHFINRYFWGNTPSSKKSSAS